MPCYRCWNGGKMAHMRTTAQRSRNMAAIRSKNSRPELVVRSLLHSLGFRFRIHQADLPGKPDVVLPRFKAVIFVHGCFWHMHHCKKGVSTPTTNREFWRSKRVANEVRDRRQIRKLRFNWRVLVVWQCQMKDPVKLERRLLHFLRKCATKDGGR
jgi:DNA mismatch endonuclease, patch repair protein